MDSRSILRFVEVRRYLSGWFRRRTEWMVSSSKQAQDSNRMWWHVYLDNYASGERTRAGKIKESEHWQSNVENWWEEAGIVCSRSKTRTSVTDATELGAFIEKGNG